MISEGKYVDIDSGEFYAIGRERGKTGYGI